MHHSSVAIVSPLSVAVESIGIELREGLREGFNSCKCAARVQTPMLLDRCRWQATVPMESDLRSPPTRLAGGILLQMVVYHGRSEAVAI